MSKSVLPITGRQTGELCRLLEERGVGGQQFQLLIEQIDVLVCFTESLKPHVSFQRDMTKDGWVLEEDVSGPELNSIAALETVSFVKDGEKWISSEEMIKRAKELGAMLGQHHAEWLLERQKEIPKEWLKVYIVFPGTVWRDPGGRLYVPYLGRDGEQWCLRFGCLDFDWRSGGRLLRLSN